MLTFIAVILVKDVALLVADAATIEAGALASITIDAPLYDTRKSGEGGCNPAGCSGDLTRVSSNSGIYLEHPRWSVLNVFHPSSYAASIN